MKNWFNRLFSNDKEQVLNLVFYVTFMYPVIVLYFLMSENFNVSYFALLLGIIMPILGYKVKKGSLVASKILLGVFIVERIMGVNNLVKYYQYNPVSIINFVLITFALWQVYYRPYFLLKRSK